jgi:alpha-D-ribose 1-methylphosphonate 5-triphosphate synthase subunit PhnI
MRVIRRISAAFKEIPGGQILGPTPDYTLRLLDFDLREESRAGLQAALGDYIKDIQALDPLPEHFPKVVEMLRQEGLLVARAGRTEPDREIFDVTRQAISFPAPRSARLQTLARGETGGLLALAYSNMRGYGSVHPVIGELRVGYLPLPMKNPVSGELETLGEIKVTEAEVIARLQGAEGRARFNLGYGLCFGHNETKAIAMAVLDRAMAAEEPTSPSEDPEFVLTHIDGIEATGFCNHYKLPHYVTFQSDLDRLRQIQSQGRPNGGAPETDGTEVPA